ncbi:hypothetical protein CTI12_AA132050 [Artemisia annua]|uniref:Uncharacterized protein n=1 Tax=Artemisia annua TaxID=35608 RepID=A0A2U1P0I9_ARTAN|nr:hypothetical protein CTI12_AA132050 [Artemisia annua]
MSLNLKSGGIKINRETVNTIMGFPMGKEKIKYIKRVQTNNPTIISWRNQFHRYKNSKETNIRVTEVVNVILDNGNTDRMFLLNFFVVLSSCLCLPGSGVACQKILSFIPDFDDDIKKLDWCSYLLDCLKDSKKKWNKYDTSGANYYCGPVTFLSLLYVEAILKQQKKNRQEGPAIEYWNSDLLYEVQKADRMLNEGYD